MKDFDKQKNALRIKFKAEQRQITKDCHRTIGRINTAIGQVKILEAREALRAEKQRVYENMRRSHELNKTCYLQQLDLIDDEISQYRERHPSKRRIRSILEAFCRSAEADGNDSLSIQFSENRIAKISFE
ncbi:MAG: hypothetical protein K2G13_02610 [Muribaculaceae bacterium]|nr:hypothetical protein [Muribaculaceae bacterium]